MIRVRVGCVKIPFANECDDDKFVRIIDKIASPVLHMFICINPIRSPMTISIFELVIHLKIGDSNKAKPTNLPNDVPLNQFDSKIRMGLSDNFIVIIIILYQ